MRSRGRTLGCRTWRVPVAIAAVLLAISACTVAPARAPATTPAVPPNIQAVAREVSITGPDGSSLDGDERRAVVGRVVRQGRSELMKTQLAAMASNGDVDLYAGNAVRLLIDGPKTFEAMFNAIRSARHSIYLESYIVEDANIAQELAELLRANGVKVCKFNPLNPLERPGYWGISHRDHRKILVVDEAIGFTGGINISSVYSTGSMRSSHRSRVSPQNEQGWRDTQMEIRGPAARALSELLRETWRAQGCSETLRPMPDAASARAAGPQLVRIVPASPEDESNRIYTLLLGSIDAAEHSVYMTMAYFAPGEEMLDALCRAARRGVSVKLILPSKSDFTPVLHAGRANYARLLEAGVEVHELQIAVLHAKTAVIDGVVSTVGSSNMDWRSFSSNNEVNAVVMGEDFGGIMTKVFERDLTMSQPIDAATWAQRPLLQRMKETLFGLFERLW
ncbi:MAG: phospholipase D-like domain-containing protein [Propionivibrio sp.]